ncbi:RES domain-containing protein OS=Castellaniella defragrans OX=75697 GN=HNR28_000642 PE=4 SV=1 [Castellaniella defragrans]
MVEAQHIAATMKLVDGQDEQDLLESLLESSKPARAAETDALHYLLATPFRYHPLRTGSRFRASDNPGVFYGAQSIRTAAAELGYWRWRFLQDTAGMERLEPVAHTVFRAAIATSVVNLRQPPFDADRASWQHPTNYEATQRFARTAREAGVGGILYQSVRDPEPSWCLALLTPKGFAKPKPYKDQQTWFLAVSHEEVTLRRDAESFRFATEKWAQPQ